MLFRSLAFVRYVALLLLLILLFPASPVLAASDMVWSFSEGNDASNRGRMTARLGYGVPETDNVQLDGVCEARSGTAVMSANLILGADVGKLADGANVNVRFTGGGFNHFISGSVYGTRLEEGITGISLDVKVNDPLWKALTEQDSLDYLVPGYSASKLALKGGHDKIRQFIRACRSYAEALGPEKTVKTREQPKKTAQYQTAAAEKKPTPPSGVSEKEAYDAAKELGTIEAWEAFLNNFQTGFRADLARAYLKRIASEASPPPAPVQTLAPPPPPPPPVVIATPPPPPLPPLAPINLGPGTSPWGNGVFPMDEGNSSVYSASVKSSGLELVAYCGIDRTLTMLLTERPPGVYPQFSGRIAQGLAASRLSMQFSNGAFYPVAASVQGLTGDVELRSTQGGGFNPNGPIAEGLMSGNSVTLSAPPFGATFQLTKSRAAICSVVNNCGVSVAGCQRFRAPAVTTRQPAIRKKTITRKSPAGKCSSRSVWLDGQCILKSAVASYCGPGFHRAGSNCVSNANRATTAPVTGRCSSRSVWLDGQCILKSQVTSFCGPGYHREGSKCVSNANRATTAPGGCPPGQTQIGNNCININLAPLFGKPKKSGQGGGQKNQPQTVKQTGQSKATQKPKVQNNALQCGSGFTLTLDLKRNPVCTSSSAVTLKCPKNHFERQLQGGLVKCEARGTGSKAPAGVKCPRGSVWMTHRCVTCASMNHPVLPNGQCNWGVGGGAPTGIVQQVVPQKQQPPKIACSGGGQVINRRCVCPSNRPRLENGKCKKPKGNQIIQQLQQPQNRQQPQVQQQRCISNQVRYANGNCGCPSNKPRWSKGKCKKQKAVNKLLQQLQQPKNQPRQQQQQRPRTQPQQQPQPQPQQNQQLQQGINNLLNQFSDARLKRDVELLATLSSGIRLYAFRYLWEDTLRVGVMAQDLLDNPAWREAVSLHRSGYYRVDYGALGLRMVTLEEWRLRGRSSVLARPSGGVPNLVPAALER